MRVKKKKWERSVSYILRKKKKKKAGEKKVRSKCVRDQYSSPSHLPVVLSTCLSAPHRASNHRAAHLALMALPGAPIYLDTLSTAPRSALAGLKRKRGELQVKKIDGEEGRITEREDNGDEERRWIEMVKDT